MAGALVKVKEKIRQRGFRYVMKRLSAHVTGKPSSLTLDISAACNIRCIMCSLDRWAPKGFMSLEVIEALRHVLPKVPLISLSCSGEPLVHPRFDMLLHQVRAYARDAFLEFHTNGMLLGQVVDDLIDNRVGCVSVSMDGVSQETFERIRKGAVLSKVINGVRLLQEKKMRRGVSIPAIALRFVALKSNLSELPSLVDVARKLDASTLHVENVEPYTEEIAREAVYEGASVEDAEAVFREAERKAREIGLRIDLPPLRPARHRACIWSTPVVYWDGTVKPCFILAYDRPVWTDGLERRREETNFGNVLKDDFWHIWYSPAYRTFRERLKRQDFTGACEHCLVSRGMLISMPNK